MRLRHIIITAMLLSMPCISHGAAAWSTFDPNKPANTRRWDKADDDIRTNWAALWAFLQTATDGLFIVGNGTNWVTESGETLRTSIGVGTGDSPQLTAVNFGHATQTTLDAPAAGRL